LKILSIIYSLATGGGRILIDVIDGFPKADHTVWYQKPFGDLGCSLDVELGQRAVPHAWMSLEEFPHALRELAPDIVLCHWWSGFMFSRPNWARNPWVVIIHENLPAPGFGDHYVPTSRRNHLIQSHLPESKKTVIYNGIDLDRIDCSPTERNGHFVIGRVSHLHEKKIPEDYIDFACSMEIPNVRHHIIGSGRMLHSLRERVRVLGVEDRFYLPGEIPHQRIMKEIKAFDISCYLTGHHTEVFSMAILEMMAAGIPVVAEPRGGIPEQIVHGRNGFLAGSRDEVRSFCESLYKDRGLRQEMSREARDMAKAFDVRLQWKRYRDLIERLS